MSYQVIFLKISKDNFIILQFLVKIMQNLNINCISLFS